MFEILARGEFVRAVYRLGVTRATGVLTAHPARGGTQTLVVRRGDALAPPQDTRGRALAQRLAALAAASRLRYRFDGGAAACPPGATPHRVALASWVRAHLERQVDSAHAQRLVHQLAGVRLVLRADLAPDPSTCDATDRRILDALRVPRRLDQLWPLARTPRFRMLTFLHFLHQIGAVQLEGVAAPAPRRDGPAEGARRLLGVPAGAGRDEVKRAYRRLARALHPDLHPSASASRRQALARKFGEVSDAYRELSGVE